MGCWTPNIDRIGHEGATFTDYYGQQSCTAGRAAFITGQSPIRFTKGSNQHIICRARCSMSTIFPSPILIARMSPSPFAVMLGKTLGQAVAAQWLLLPAAS
jgi:hypothetical protein